MINLEQVKLLEKKVAKTVDYVERLVKENADLYQQKTELQKKLESCQKQVDELELAFKGFKDDQNQIEEGILAALDRLNQFEKAMEKSLKAAGTKAKEPAAKPAQTAPEETAETAGNSGSDNGKTCFEIPESDTSPENDISDPLHNTSDAEAAGRELEIF